MLFVHVYPPPAMAFPAVHSVALSFRPRFSLPIVLLARVTKPPLTISNELSDDNVTITHTKYLHQYQLPEEAFFVVDGNKE